MSGGLVLCVASRDGLRFHVPRYSPVLQFPVSRCEQCKQVLVWDGAMFATWPVTVIEGL